MLKKILRGLFTLIGLISGYLIGKELLLLDYITKLEYFKKGTVQGIIFIILSMLLCALILFFISPWIISLIIKSMDYIERKIQKIPTSEVLFSTGGGIVGLIISTLFFSVFDTSSLIWSIVAVVGTIIVVTLSADIARRKREDITLIFSNIKKPNTVIKEKKSKTKYPAKILDTSVIIDGRIMDLCQTGFIEGTLVIPHFVLAELRHIADSSDDLKRNRGRRGLDILNKIQNEVNVPVELTEKDFPDINEVDSKLLKLAQVIHGKVITNDYNLNKVAKFQGVDVLNINELANAIKPVVLPGEEMKIQIIKDGKESGQGIAYLDDGTMIVVEGAKRHIGEHMNVIVTSVLQTAAGRMIFAKRKENGQKAQ